MKIEIKNFKYAAFASQETLCYTATVYVDGVKLGDASNSGHGGNTNVFVTPENRDLLKKVEAHCLTLPPSVGDGFELPMNLEFFLDLLASQKLAEKELKSAMRNKIVIVKPNLTGEIFYVSLRNGAKLTPEIIADYASQNPTYTILNLLPLEDALRLFNVQ